MMIISKLKSAWSWAKRKWKTLLIALGVISIATASFLVGGPLDIEYVTADDYYISMDDLRYYYEGGKRYEIETDLMKIITPIEGEATTTNRIHFEAKRMAYHAYFTGWTEVGEPAVATMDSVKMKYEVGDTSIIFKPVGLRWSTGDIISNTQENVIPQVSGNTILWPNLYGSGLSVKGEVLPTEFKKLFVIDSKASLGAPPVGATYIEIAFEIDRQIVIDGWDNDTEMEIVDGQRIGDFSYFRNTRAWTDTTSTDIKSYLLKRPDGKRYLVKRIPGAWLKDADYPVYTDTDISYGQHQLAANVSTAHQQRSSLIGTNKVSMCFMDSATSDLNCKIGVVQGQKMQWGSRVKKAEDVYDGTNYKYIVDTCPLGNDKFAVVYTDDTAADNVKIQVGQASTSTYIAWGNESVISLSNSYIASCNKLDTDKGVVCYSISNFAYCTAFTVSGLNVSATSSATLDTDDLWFSQIQTDTEQLDTDKFVVCYRDYTDYDGYCAVGTVSGTTITMGSRVAFTPNYDSLDYPGDRVSIISPETDVFVVTWGDSDSDSIFSRVGTVATRTITFGDTGSMLTKSYNFDSFSTSKLSSDKAVLVANYTGSRGVSVYFSIDSVGRTVSSSSLEYFEYSDLFQGTAAYNDNTINSLYLEDNKYLVIYQVDDSNDYLYSIIGSYTGGFDVADFSYYKELTVNDGWVAGGVATTTTREFVILASTTDADLRTTTWGGNVEKDFGEDIAFVADDQTTLLDFEIEKYSSTTGRIIAWIEMPSVSSTTESTLYMYYGNANATGYQNVQGTWRGEALAGNDPFSTSTVGVWHLSESTSTDSYAYDSTSNNNDGTFTNTDYTDQVEGAIDGSVDFDGSNDYIDLPQCPLLNGDAFTIVFWASIDVRATYDTYARLCVGTNIGLVIWHSIDDNTKIRFQLGNGSKLGRFDFTDTMPIEEEYHQIVGTYDGVDKLNLYFDSNLSLASTTDLGPATFSGVARSISHESPGYGVNGRISEFRIYNRALTAADIATIYNMEYDNPTFLTWGAEQETATPPAAPSGVGPSFIWFD